MLKIYDFEAHIMLAWLFKVPDYQFGKNLTPGWRRRVNILLVIYIDLYA